MGKTKRKLLETLNGTGSVFKGDKKISTVRYNITVKQQFDIIESQEGDEEIPGQKEISGQIRIIEGERNLTDGNILTLYLEDNRRWQFWANRGNPVSGVYSAVNASGEDIK